MNAKAFIEKLSDDELLDYARDWSKGVKFATQILMVLKLMTLKNCLKWQK